MFPQAIVEGKVIFRESLNVREVFKHSFFFLPQPCWKKNGGLWKRRVLDLMRRRWGEEEEREAERWSSWHEILLGVKKFFFSLKKNEKGKQKEVVREEIKKKKKNHDRAAWANTLCPRRAVVSACVHVVTLLSCAFLKPLLPFAAPSAIPSLLHLHKLLFPLSLPLSLQI